MIAKRVLRGKAGDFRRLGAYIVGGPTRGAQPAPLVRAEPKALAATEAVIWQRTADYILDAVGKGGRTAAVRISNCQATDIDVAISEIIATQQKNRRARGERTYHLVVSFPPGERPTPAQLQDIEDELCRAIGLGKHQRLSAIHTDTRHLHMHIAINQVHPETFACIEPWYDKKKLMTACQRLEIKHGLIRTHTASSRKGADGAPLPQGARAMEVKGGLQSMLGWLREEIRPQLVGALDQSGGWQALHKLLGEHGLTIKKRGAGLVVAEVNGRRMVKASDVDRRLGLKALETKLGAFTTPDAAMAAELRKSKHSTYRRRPMHREVDELFEDWQRLRDERRAAGKELEEWIERRAASITKRFDADIAFVRDRSAWTGVGRARRYLEIDVERAAEWRREHAWVDEQRKALRQTHPLPSWPDYLREAAAKGNASALRALRRNAERHRTALTAVMRRDDSEAAQNAIRTELKPEVYADGQVLYRLRDGGKVTDDGNTIRIEKPSPVASALVVALMAQRSDAHAVVIPTAHAPSALIASAARAGLEVRFADPTHEQERQRLIPTFEREEATLAAAVFIAARNQLRGNDASIPRHRLPLEGESGSAIFERLETFADGVGAAVLRKDGDMLVVPLSKAQAADAARHAPGETVELSAISGAAQKGAQR